MNWQLFDLATGNKYSSKLFIRPSIEQVAFSIFFVLYILKFFFMIE
jgi:hypothetical protein